MKTFEYRGLGENGRSCRGLVEALSVKEARKRLAAEGVLAERISLTGRRLRFPAEIRATTYLELSALLDAGMPLVRALDIMIESPETADARILLAAVRDRVREGAGLAEALAEASDSVTPFEQAVVEAAERSASVGLMLARLASVLEDQERVRERVRNALIYPSIVLGLGICVAILMLGLLLPMSGRLLASGGVQAPALTRMTVAVGHVALRWGWLPTIALCGLLFYTRRRWRADNAFRVQWSRRLFRLPVFGKGLTLLVNLRFARTLSILLQGGVSAVDSMALAGRATGNAWVAERGEAEADAVRHGSSLSAALTRIPPLAGSLPGWLRVGEAGGGLERILDSAARRYEAHWDRFVARCLSLLEPVLIFLIGGFVLLITLSVLLPVISMTDTIGH